MSTLMGQESQDETSRNIVLTQLHVLADNTKLFRGRGVLQHGLQLCVPVLKYFNAAVHAVVVVVVVVVVIVDVVL